MEYVHLFGCMIIDNCDSCYQAVCRDEQQGYNVAVPMNKWLEAEINT